MREIKTVRLISFVVVLCGGLWSGCSAGSVSTDPAPLEGSSPASSGISASVAAVTASSAGVGGGLQQGTGSGGAPIAETSSSTSVATASSGSASSETTGAGGGGGTQGGNGGGGASASVASSTESVGIGGSGGAPGETAGAGGANNCNLPKVVSFQNDIQKAFLIPSCGTSGCHVVDAASTKANGGFNHGYDWITAGAHTSSCPSGPKRFEVVLDVIQEANPSSCSKSRKMPPPGAAVPGLTPCQIAALKAWLGEPMVLQTHRPDDSSPTTPYLMPPFN